jgi:hypothetical protein
MRKKWGLLVGVAAVLAVCLPAGATSVTQTMQAGGDRLVSTENTGALTSTRPKGSWGPLYPPATGDRATAPRIGMGLLSAYESTGDVRFLTAAKDAGNYISSRTGPTHQTADGIFMSALSLVTGDASYVNDVKTEFYDRLHAGTYLYSGANRGIAAYADLLLGTNQGVWNVALAAVGAKICGASQADLDIWAQKVGDAINRLDSYPPDQVLGLAGGVWALAELGKDFDPTLGYYGGVGGPSSLSDLAAVLASYQTTSGGFAFTDGIVRTNATVYAIFALNEFGDPYRSQVVAAGNYLASTQLSAYKIPPTYNLQAGGGWQDHFIDYNNIEERNVYTGEALWGIWTAVPEPLTMLGVFLGVSSLGAYIRRRKLA